MVCTDGTCSEPTTIEDGTGEIILLDGREIGLSLNRDTVGIQGPLRAGEPDPGVEWTIEVTDSEDTVLAETTATPRYERTQPNGPDCEPVCWQYSESF